MKYEVTLKISYATQVFEFDTIEEAATFAKMVLEHSVTRDDDRRIEVVLIAVSLVEEPTEDEMAACRELCGDD